MKIRDISAKRQAQCATAATTTTTTTMIPGKDEGRGGRETSANEVSTLEDT